MSFYENTPENAKRIGWASVPEYWVGNPNAPYVKHDDKAGKFIFTNAAVCGRCGILKRLDDGDHYCGDCGELI